MRMNRRDAILTAAAGLFSIVRPRRVGAGESRHLIWRKPAPASEILLFGPSGRAKQPVAPFRFEEEDRGGSNPKIKVRDASGAQWIAKWGEEVHSEAFASRVAAAAGYFTRTAVYVPEGRIEGAHDLTRASDCVDSKGGFEKAVFKLIALDQPYLQGNNWSWTNNPFLADESGRQRLNGLKVVMMLTSNWDNKDASEPARGPNTAIYDERRGEDRSFLYAFDDWGATMGRWGGVIGRSKWDAEGFAEQSGELVSGLSPDGFIEWGFDGKNASDLKDGIRPADVGALLQHFDHVQEQNWKESLSACGASPEQADVFARSLVRRFSQLRKVST